MKRFLALLAVLVLVLTCSMMGIGTVASAAAESPEEDFLVYDGVLEEYVGPGGDVVIPASLGVTEIAAQAFYNNLDITSIVIPEGVEVVGYWAFNGCENNESVTLPYSLEELAEHCFTSNSITEIVIPGNVDIVGYGAFSGCTFLEKITLSYGIKEIQVFAFQATAAPEVVFPETVELICGASFVNLNYDGKYEYTICNPDCEIGPGATTSQAAYKHQWTYTNANPFNSAKYSVTFQFIVPKDSELEATFSQDHYKNPKGDQSKDDRYLVKTKDAEYFEQYGEGWGMKEPEKNEVPGDTPNPGDKTPSGGDKTPTSGDKTQSGTQGGTQTIIQGSNSGMGTTLVIIIAVFGGIMLLAIIAVVILLATGKLGGKKEVKPAAEEDPEIAALREKIEEKKKAKLLEELQAELEELDKE